MTFFALPFFVVEKKATAQKATTIFGHTHSVSKALSSRLVKDDLLVRLAYRF